MHHKSKISWAGVWKGTWRVSACQEGMAGLAAMGGSVVVLDHASIDRKSAMPHGSRPGARNLLKAMDRRRRSGKSLPGCLREAAPTCPHGRRMLHRGEQQDVQGIPSEEQARACLFGTNAARVRCPRMS